MATRKSSCRSSCPPTTSSRASRNSSSRTNLHRLRPSSTPIRRNSMDLRVRNSRSRRRPSSRNRKFNLSRKCFKENRPSRARKPSSGCRWKSRPASANDSLQVKFHFFRLIRNFADSKFLLPEFCFWFSVEQTTRTVQLHPADLVRPPSQPVVAIPPAVIPRPVDPAQPLEPFPFVPDPPQPRKVHSPMSFASKPSKFIPAGYSRESDYESDYDGAKIRPRWTPAGSDAEYEPAYRKVRPPSSTPVGNGSKRAASGARSPTPPSVFDQPPSFQGPPRPVISPTDVIKIKSALQQSEERPVLLVKPKAIRPPPPAPAVSQPALQPAEEPIYSYAEPPPPTAAAARK